MLLYTLYRNPLRCFRNTAATFVACLSVADFLTGAITAMDVGVFSLLNANGIPSLKVMGVLQDKLVSQFTVRSGILVVVVFSIERFLAVATPYFYRNQATPKKALVTGIFCFIIGLLASLSELVLDKKTFGTMSYYGFFVAPLSIILLAYLSIYIAIKHKLRKTMSMQLNNAQQRQRLQIKRECQLGLTAFYIVLGFLFSYCFWFTVVLIGNICPSCKIKSWYSACYRISIPFLYVNSALNPLLYAWRMPKYRRSFLLVLQSFHLVRIRPLSSPKETKNTNTSKV